MLSPAGAGEDPVPAEAPAVAAARTALEQGEHRRALMLLQDRLQQAPTDSAARRLLVRVRLDLGQGAEAEQDLRRLRIQPDSQREQAAVPQSPGLAAADLADLGRALLLQGQSLRLIGAIDPGAAKGDDKRLRAELSALVGEAHLNLGERDAARLRLHEARALDPANPRALLGLARLAFMDTPAARAAELVAQALAADPASAPGYELQGELAYLGGDRRAAEQAYTRSIEHAANPWMTHFRRAMVRIDLNDLEGAAADIDAARAGDPDFPGLDLAAGALALRRGDPGAAAPLLETFLKSAPTDPQGRYLASLALAQTGRQAQALRTLEPLLESARSGEPAVALLRAAILLDQGQAAQAEQVLLPISGAAGPPEVDEALHRALTAQGRQADAMAVLQRLAERAPERPDYALALAAGLAGAGDRAGARAPLQRLLTAVPDNLDAALALARLDLADGATAGALTQAHALAQARPQDARVQELLGSALAAAGDGAGARAALERAVALDPRATGAALALARLELEAKDPKAARVPLEALLRADAQNTAAVLLLAALDAQEQHPEAAALRLREGLAAAPQNLQWRLALAQLLASRNDTAGALAVLAAVPAQQAGEAALLQARGALELAAGQNAQALGTFEQLAATVPDAAGPRYLIILARTAEKAPKDPVKLAEDLADALGRDPAHPLAGPAVSAVFAAQPSDEARALLAVRLVAIVPAQPALAFERGRLALARGDQPAALEALRAAVQGAPEEPRYRRVLVLALAAAGETEPALEAGRDWLSAHPDDPQVRAALAQLELGQGRTAPAIEHYRAILARTPKDPIALNNLAMLLLPTDPKAALTLAEQAHDARPEQAEIADTLGAVLLALHEPARALTVLERAAAADTANPSLTYHLAAALAATGARERARTLLEGLSGQAFPERDAARVLLGQLAAGR
jgi:putative PEP-CTERM system TPR-repeat lipoprotein